MRQTSARKGGVEGVRRPPRFQLLSEVIGELKKVTWPTREEATRLTILVIVVSVTIGIALGLIDLGFARLFELII